MSERTLGQIGYEAYSDMTEHRSLVTGDELPGWSHLAHDIRNAWELAAATIAATVEKRWRDAGRETHGEG